MDGDLLFTLSNAAGRVIAPAGDSLSFASPKESKQRKGDPTVCVPSLRYGQPAVLGQSGVSLELAALRQSRALIRFALRSSAHTEGVWRETAEQPNTENHTDTPWRVLVCLGIRFIHIPFVPFWLGRAAQMEAGSGPQLFERSEFCGPPPESSSAGGYWGQTPISLRCMAPHPAGELKARRIWALTPKTRTQTAGRLSFGDFSLAKQRKVTSRRATPGQRPTARPARYQFNSCLQLSQKGKPGISSNSRSKHSSPNQPQSRTLSGPDRWKLSRSANH